MKTLALIPVLLALAPSLGAAEIRLLVFGATEAPAPAGPDRSPAALEGFFDAARIRQMPAPPEGPDSASLEGADAVLLDDRSLAIAGRFGADAVEALARAVRGGKALVVSG